MLVNAVFVVVVVVWLHFSRCYLNGSQPSHSQRFLILFHLFFWMVHARGRCYSLSPSLSALTYSDV